MGHRLSKIRTKTGDDGTTGLGDGTRIAKTAARIEAMGSVDELNCALGLLLCQPDLESYRSALADIQHRLFDLGGELAVPTLSLITAEHVLALEVRMDALNADLPPLKEFVLPGGNPGAAHCHMARSIARRAERDVWRVAAESTLNPLATTYLNRLSDLLFVIARRLARATGAAESTWQRD